MPSYRFLLPVRAIGGYRLSEAGITTSGLTLMPSVDPAYTARVENVQAENVRVALGKAQELVQHFFGYLALLGEDSAFILDSHEGLHARNVDLERNPIPADQPAPPLESVGSMIITKAGQEYFGAACDPDGSNRRSGVVAVLYSRGTFLPGHQTLSQVTDLFVCRETAPDRVRLALGILHDAACAREFANGFAQSYTALEVLTQHLKPPNVIDAFYSQAKKNGTDGLLAYKQKADLLAALDQFLVAASIPGAQAGRIIQYAATTQSASQVDVLLTYLKELNINVTRQEVKTWIGIRGKLVHAAETENGKISAMRHFREVVRTAVMTELQRAANAKQ